MLQAVLTKEDCAACQWCCYFFESETEEYPRFSTDFAQKFPVDVNGRTIKYVEHRHENMKWVTFDLTGRFCEGTEATEGWAACPFLDESIGCVLPAGDKAFDCSSWPVRYMRFPDGEKRVCISEDCKVISKIELENLKRWVKEEWKCKICEMEQKYPYITQEFREGYTIIE